MALLLYRLTPILYKIDGNHFNILNGDLLMYGHVLNVGNVPITGQWIILNVKRILLKAIGR